MWKAAAWCAFAGIQPVSARSLEGRRDADYAKNSSRPSAAKLVSVGINLDLAPVLDGSENPMDTFRKRASSLRMRASLRHRGSAIG
ncbi:MAG: hypothetical protein R2881_05765 [Eubacteriales bacterium]